MATSQKNKQSTKRTPSDKADQSYEGFSAAEKAAMKDRAKELKAEARRGAKKEEAERDMLAKIAEMSASDRATAERLHEIIKAAAPDLDAKLWYGMPAYARNGKNVCYFTPAEKFGTRYSTIGFDDGANLDDGTMWPVAFAITKLTAADEKRIGQLVRQAVS